MRALTLWQPWASFMAAGIKRNETRSWPTSYRGDVAVCAARRQVPEVSLALCARLRDSEFHDGSDRSVAQTLDRMPRGEVVCVVELHDCRRSEEFDVLLSPARLTALERDLGDYSPRRWVWLTRNPRRLKVPVPVVGRQGLFVLPLEVERAVLGQLQVVG